MTETPETPDTTEPPPDLLHPDTAVGEVTDVPNVTHHVVIREGAPLEVQPVDGE